MQHGKLDNCSCFRSLVCYGTQLINWFPEWFNKAGYVFSQTPRNAASRHTWQLLQMRERADGVTSPNYFAEKELLLYIWETRSEWVQTVYVIMYMSVEYTQQVAANNDAAFLNRSQIWIRWNLHRFHLMLLLCSNWKFPPHVLDMVSIESFSVSNTLNDYMNVMIYKEFSIIGEEHIYLFLAFDKMTIIWIILPDDCNLNHCMPFQWRSNGIKCCILWSK